MYDGLESLFDPIERRRNVLRPGYINEDLETLRGWNGCPRWLIGGSDIKYTWL